MQPKLDTRWNTNCSVWINCCQSILSTEEQIKPTIVIIKYVVRIRSNGVNKIPRLFPLRGFFYQVNSLKPNNGRNQF